jgi:predicted RNA-binding Zn ribbon-like protein
MRDAPIVGDTMALDLANTQFAVRGKPMDGLSDTAALDRWLTFLGRGIAPDFAADAVDLASFVELRQAIRAVARAQLLGHGDISDAVECINYYARAKRTTPVLVMGDEGLVSRSESAESGMHQTVADFAWDAIELFGTERRMLLRSCPAPDCPLLFIKDHSRRKWCQPSCANRVRAARAYRKKRNAIGMT